MLMREEADSQWSLTPSKDVPLGHDGHGVVVSSSVYDTEVFNIGGCLDITWRAGDKDIPRHYPESLSQWAWVNR